MQDPKRNDEVWVKSRLGSCWSKREFLADLGEGINPRYICRFEDSQSGWCGYENMSTTDPNLPKTQRYCIFNRVVLTGVPCPSSLHSALPGDMIIELGKEIPGGFEWWCDKFQQFYLIPTEFIKGYATKLKKKERIPHWVHVRNDKNKMPDKRILVGLFSESMNPYKYKCVEYADAKSYIAGMRYCTARWKYMQEIPEKTWWIDKDYAMSQVSILKGRNGGLYYVITRIERGFIFLNGHPLKYEHVAEKYVLPNDGELYYHVDQDR